MGAGPAGLMASWRAAQAGHDVTLVERSHRVGGMSASHEVAGLRVDLGSHRLHPPTSPPVLRALQGLLGDDLQERPRHGRIRLRGRWVGFPLRAADLARRLPPNFVARAAFDTLTGPVRRLRPGPDTFAAVIRAGLGPTLASTFYEPYARKLWGLDASELSGELARRRVSASTPTALVRRLVRGASAAGRTFLYPRRGYGQISEALADAAVEAGVDLRLGAEVERLVLTEHGGRAVLTGGATVDADRVWSTAPLPSLAALVDPAPPPDVIDASAGLVHRALVLVYLVLDRPRWTSFDAHYFPGPDVVMARVSEPRNYRTNVEDPDDRTVLCAEVPCTVGDATWTSTSEHLGALLEDGLSAQGLAPPGLVAVEVVRLPRVYPVYRRGFAWDLSRLDLWAADRPRLLTFGRQGLFVPDNAHHALAMGWAAAGALGHNGRFDQAAWEASRDEFRSFVVED
ncbi:MAG: FAD-dependent oxidoreductase [Acidimicrobiales bacterium]